MPDEVGEAWHATFYYGPPAVVARKVFSWPASIPCVPLQQGRLSTTLSGAPAKEWGSRWGIRIGYDIHWPPRCPLRGSACRRQPALVSARPGRFARSTASRPCRASESGTALAKEEANEHVVGPCQRLFPAAPSPQSTPTACCPDNVEYQPTRLPALPKNTSSAGAHCPSPKKHPPPMSPPEYALQALLASLGAWLAKPPGACGFPPS